MTLASRILLATALLVIPKASRASDGDEAESLFQSARSLLADGKTGAACDAFDRSYRLDAKLGTLLNLAGCHELQGRVATAYVEFSKAAEMAAAQDRPDRITLAQSRAKALEPRVPRLVVRVEPASPDVVVTVDGVARAFDEALLFDPGEHHVTAKWPDGTSRELAVVLREGTREVRELAAPKTAGTIAPPERTSSPPPEPEPEPGPSAARTATWIAGGIGLAAIGVGTYFGLRTLSQKSDSERECSALGCSPRGLELEDDAFRSATASTVAFSVGGAAAITAVTLYVVSTPRASASTTSIRPWIGVGSVGVRGAL